MDAPDRSSLPRRASSAPRARLAQSANELPPLERAFWETLDRGLTRLRLELSTGVRDALDAHARLLLAWNSHINLTALRDAEAIARGHVIDSLLAVSALRALAAPRPALLDLGSGPGYPGLPLAVVLPAARAALVDSVTKKAAFLEVAAGAVAAALRDAGVEPPDITVLAERAEDIADEPDGRETWDLVTARAVGSVAEVAELGLPLAHRGGIVVAWKRDTGDGTLEREIDAARRIAQACGGGAPRVVELPGAIDVGLLGHCLVVIEKRRPTPDRYPRPAGERRRRTVP